MLRLTPAGKFLDMVWRVQLSAWDSTQVGPLSSVRVPRLRDLLPSLPTSIPEDQVRVTELCEAPLDESAHPLITDMLLAIRLQITFPTPSTTAPPLPGNPREVFVRNHAATVRDFDRR